MWVDPTLPRDHAITGLSAPLAEALDAMTKFGFEGIEPMIGDPDRFEWEEFRKAVYARGMRVSQICTGELAGSFGLALNDPVASARKRALVAARKSVMLASKLECKVGSAVCAAGSGAKTAEPRSRRWLNPSPSSTKSRTPKASKY
jgi:sugar phosphate isomerase/epimerase